MQRKIILICFPNTNTSGSLDIYVLKLKYSSCRPQQSICPYLIECKLQHHSITFSSTLDYSMIFSSVGFEKNYTIHSNNLIKFVKGIFSEVRMFSD